MVNLSQNCSLRFIVHHIIFIISKSLDDILVEI